MSNPRWECNKCGHSNAYWTSKCKGCGITQIQQNKLPNMSVYKIVDLYDRYVVALDGKALNYREIIDELNKPCPKCAEREKYWQAEEIKLAEDKGKFHARMFSSQPYYFEEWEKAQKN